MRKLSSLTCALRPACEKHLAFIVGFCMIATLGHRATALMRTRRIGYSDVAAKRSRW